MHVLNPRTSLLEEDEGCIGARRQAVVFMTKCQKMCSTCMATLHICLTIWPIQLFISFYQRAPWLNCLQGRAASVGNNLRSAQWRVSRMSALYSGWFSNHQFVRRDQSNQRFMIKIYNIWVAKTRKLHKLYTFDKIFNGKRCRNLLNRVDSPYNSRLA